MCGLYKIATLKRLALAEPAVVQQQSRSGYLWQPLELSALCHRTSEMSMRKVPQLSSYSTVYQVLISDLEARAPQIEYQGTALPKGRYKREHRASDPVVDDSTKRAMAAVACACAIWTGYTGGGETRLLQRKAAVP